MLSQKHNSDYFTVSFLMKEGLICPLQVAGSTDEKVLIMGATNRPQELDDAVLRWVDCTPLNLPLN